MNFAIEHQAWDSKLMGFPVGRLVGFRLSEAELRPILCGAQQEGWRLLYWSVDPDDSISNRSARDAKAFLADRKVRFVHDVLLRPQPLPPTIVPAQTLTPRLLELAWQSGHQSRFRLDPGFAPGVYEQLYEQWLRNSLSGEKARLVLQHPAAPDAEATGLVTLEVRPGRADIGLLAVHSSARRQGIGRQLVQAARHYARAWQLPQLQVVTQRANQEAFEFYQKEGFRLEHEEMVYHFWL